MLRLLIAKQNQARLMPIPQLLAFFLFIGCIAQGDEADAAAKGPLQSELSAFVVELEDGKEAFSPAATIEPGKVVEYRLAYKNISTEPLQAIAAVGPVTANTVYVAGSATAAAGVKPEFSIDGGAAFQAEPVRYKVTLPDGRVEEKVAAPDMYTHCRWLVPELAPGAGVEMRYRVQVK